MFFVFLSHEASNLLDSAFTTAASRVRVGCRAPFTPAINCASYALPNLRMKNENVSTNKICCFLPDFATLSNDFSNFS